MGALPKLIRPVTVEEFLGRPAHPRGLREQLVDGTVVAMNPPGGLHGQLQLAIGSLIRNHLRAHGSRCAAMTGAGVVLGQHSLTNVRVPDILVTCSEEDKRAKEDKGAKVIRATVIVIEVLSPGNAWQTRNNVWRINPSQACAKSSCCTRVRSRRNG